MTFGANEIKLSLNKKPDTVNNDTKAKKTDKVEDLFEDEKQKISDDKPGFVDKLFGARELNTHVKGQTYAGGTKTKEELVDYSFQLYDAMAGFGTDKKTVNKIINDSGLNSYDMLGLLVTYSNATRGYLTEDIARDFSGNEEKQLMQTIADSVFEIVKTEQPKEDKGQPFNAMALQKATKVLCRFETQLLDYIPVKDFDNSSMNIKMSTMINGIRG